MAGLFTTFQDVVRYLEAIPKFSQKGADAAHFSLDHMEKFCELMGNPHKSFRSIHVAGSNGKGTTCQMLASVYEQAGYKTGLYTSPHLVRFNERVRVNAEEIPDHEVLLFFRQFENLLEEVPLTYFEISTCLAFWYFEKKSCEICLIEVGLGGRLDATNVIDPVLSVITSVSRDHTEILGDTITEIASEKAGIIKQSRPVVTGFLSGEALKVIIETAVKKDAKVINTEHFQPKIQNEIILLRKQDSGIIKIDAKNRKRVDRLNIAISLAVVQELGSELPVSETEFIAGIESLECRYRHHAHFEKLSPDLEWYYDGAHNPEAMESLIEQVEFMRNRRDPVWILSMMKDKAVAELLENFLPYTNVYYIETGSERCAKRNQILSILPNTRVFSSENPEFLKLLDGFKSKLVIFAGSFYFYSEVKKWMASLKSSDQAKNTGLRR